MYKCACHYKGDVYGPMCHVCFLFIWSWLNSHDEYYGASVEAELGA